MFFNLERQSSISITMRLDFHLPHERLKFGVRSSTASKFVKLTIVHTPNIDHDYHYIEKDTSAYECMSGNNW